jgi:hypothetical protein
MPTSWQTTSGIHRRNPACGRQAPRKSGCAGGVKLSRCRLMVQPAVYQGNFQLVWRIKSVSCGRAHIRFENQSNPTNLNKSNKYNNWYNDNKYNKHKKSTKLNIMSILTIMTIITIFRIVVCFQRWHECTVQRFGPGVGLWCGWEKEQNPCIPTWIWRHHEGSMVETRRPNYDGIQAVTAIKRLGRKRVPVNSLYTIVLGVTKHQTVVQWEMALALRLLCQDQCLKQSIYLHNN